MRFSQVDVFSSEPLRGNPVAVVHGADGLDRRADGGVRPLDEPVRDDLPAHPDRPGGRLPAADLDAGRRAAVRRAPDARQRRTRGSRPGECPPVTTSSRSAAPGSSRSGVCRRRGSRLAFAAPPLTRSGPVDADDVVGICRALRVPEAAIVETTWIDNGPGWVGVLLADAAAVLALEPDWAAFGDLKIGVVGPYAEGPLAVEVRAFCPGLRDAGGPGDRLAQRRDRPVARGRAGCPRRTSRARGPCCSAPAGCTWGWGSDGQVWVGATPAPRSPDPSTSDD